MPDQSENNGCFTAFLWTAGAVIVFFIACWIFGDHTSVNGSQSFGNSGTSSTLINRELHAGLNTTLTTFSLINKDNFDYTGNVILTINGKYNYRTSKAINSTELFQVGLMQFADDDGNRFNPIQQKILSIDISCDEGFSHYELNQ